MDTTTSDKSATTEDTEVADEIAVIFNTVGRETSFVSVPSVVEPYRHRAS
jgi:hypothetical protein